MPKGEITDSYLCNANNQIFFKDPLNLDLNPRFFRSKMVQICCLHDLKGIIIYIYTIIQQEYIDPIKISLKWTK